MVLSDLYHTSARAVASAVPLEPGHPPKPGHATKPKKDAERTKTRAGLPLPFVATGS